MTVFDRRDAALILVFMAVGLALRLVWFSGYGLGDDVNWLSFVEWIQHGEIQYRQSYGHRITWWLPTVVLARVLGPTEAALIAPITAASVLEIGVAYAIGKLFWGRAGACIAAALFTVHPLDFAWSTMLATDFIPSLFSALSFYALLRATLLDDSLSRRRHFVLAALALWLAFHGKISALTIAPALAFVAWRRRGRLGREALSFCGVAALLFGASASLALALDGSVLAPYENEMFLAGMRSPEATRFHLATADTFWLYPRWLFGRDHLGGWIHGGQPHWIVAFAAASVFLPWLRTSKEAFVWFVAVLVAMQFQGVTLRDGLLLAAFRNVRHGHGLVFPVVLLLTGYLVSLRLRHRRLGTAALCAVLAASLGASVEIASKTHATFGDERGVARYLATLPPQPVFCDFHLANWFPILHAKREGLTFRTLSGDREVRRQEIAAITEGYLVTGGGRDPYYGCSDCIVRADEVPPGRWRLLREFPGPKRPTAWRREPARVWEALGEVAQK